MAAIPKTGVELVAKGAGTFFGTLDKAGGKIASFGKSAAVAAAKATAAIGAFGVAIAGVSIKAAVDFESAFAGVIKTTDGLVDEFGKLTESGERMQQGFRDLAKEIPVAVEELLAIGELGGQLGIAEDNLIDFTRTMAAMGEASNLSAEAAATGFAQIANVMQTPQDQIENMASSVVELGNNFATTESDILSFAQRIAGAGKIAGLTESDVFAIGAAFSSVGVQAEAGGTAVQKTLLTMNQAVLEGGDTLEIFAATAGMTAADFSKAFETDAGGAFTSFVEGLGMAGDDAVAILDALELKDQRLIKAFLSLAGAGDLLAETMDKSNDAFEDNTALTKEAEARYRTTASQFKLLQNNIKDVAITIGQTLLPFINRLIQAAKPLINEFGQRLPAVIAKVSDFFRNVLIPTFQSVVMWLSERIPVAASIVVTFFNSHIRPALEKLQAFIRSNVVPAFEKFVETLIKVARFVIKNKKVLVGALVGIGAALALAFSAKKVAGIIKLIKTFKQLFTIGKIVAALSNPIGWLIIAAALLGAAWAANWGGIREKTAAVWEFLKPVLENIVAFFSELIPRAMQTINEFWTGTLQPTFQAIGVWIVDNIIPALEEFVEWLSVAIPAAFQAVGEFWSTTLQPALESIGMWIQENVIPALKEFWEWLGEAIPVAFQIAADFWTSVLQPALSAIGGFITGTIIPAISTLVTWLSENLPLAFAAVQEFWLSTLQPALSSIWEFITNTLLPAIGNIVSAIGILLVEAFGLAQAAWNEILEPVLSAIWEFARDNLLPIIEDIINAIGPLMEIAFGNLEAAWNEVLKPAFEAIVKFVSEDLMPIVEDVVSAFGIGFEMAFNLFQSAWNNVGKKTVDAIIGVIEGLIDIVREVIGFIGDIISAAGDAVEAVQGLVGATGQGPVVNQLLQNVGVDPDAIPSGQAGGFTTGGLVRTHPAEALVPLTNMRGVNLLANAMRKAIEMTVAMPAVAATGGGSQQTIINVEVNPTLAGTPTTESMFFDVTAALLAAQL